MAFIDVLLSPLGFGLLVALIAWLGRRRLPRALLRASLAIECVCLALTTQAGANVLVKLQERRTPMPSACAAPEPNVIVLLSGGMRRDAADARDFGVLNISSLQRTLAAATLAKTIPDAELVITGGPRIGGASDVAQSSVMADVAERLGVPASAIRAELAATTTWENATTVRALEPKLPTRIWLVTSALHMPRSLIAFRAAGFEPCAYAGDYRAAPLEGPADFLPSAGAIANADAVLHEWAGEIAYRIRAAF
ncbi:MAG TPA: YdcF family protein [Rhodanobacteraceae bacterium]|nr:YdcF family protein [Rhodanobacteraceae bacterium]